MIASIACPAWFLDNLAIDELDRKREADEMFQNRKLRWRFRLQAAFAAVGLGVLMYSAMSAIVGVIPAEWGRLTEDGDWLYARNSLQTMGAIVSTVILITKAEDNARAVIWSKIHAQSRSVLMETLTNPGLQFAVTDGKNAMLYLAARGKETVERQLNPETARRGWARHAQASEKEYLLALLERYAKTAQSSDNT